MRRILLLTMTAVMLVMLVSLRAFAQIPYYAGTAGKGRLYGYTSLKVRPGINHQETYTTFQYGLGDHFDTGIDLYTGPGCAYWGALVRFGVKPSKWFNIGAEVIPSFNLNDSFKFSYLTSGLYLNGAITGDGRLFWCSNTWWIVNDGADDAYSNYEYLGYTIPLKKNRSLTPLIGAVHSWRFNQDPEPAAGLYYTFKNWNLYLWGHDFLHSHPRFVLGIDFLM